MRSAHSIRSSRFRSRGLLALAVVLLAGGALRSQACTASTGAAGGSDGGACIDVANACIGEPLGPRLLEAATPPWFGETLAVASAALLPTVATLTDAKDILGQVTRAGTVSVTGGELQRTIGLVRAYGTDNAHSFQLAIQYRSFEVDAWRTAGDGVGTVDDPFGPGWRASWAANPLKVRVAQQFL